MRQQLNFYCFCGDGDGDDDDDDGDGDDDDGDDDDDDGDDDDGDDDDGDGDADDDDDDDDDDIQYLFLFHACYLISRYLFDTCRPADQAVCLAVRLAVCLHPDLSHASGLRPDRREETGFC